MQGEGVEKADPPAPRYGAASRRGKWVKLKISAEFG
jgi:hypothetical protein